MLESTYIEIDKSALASNISFISEMLGDGPKFSSVVKGNAYGHGIETMIPLLEELKVDHFSTFNAEEAQRVLRSSSSSPTVMIMGMITDSQIEWAIENNVEFFVFNIERLKKAASTAKLMGKKARIHLELETGMNRTGFVPDKALEALDFIIKEDSLDMIGLCMHFAGAESIANYHRTKVQYQIYYKTVKKIKQKYTDSFVQHIACSAAAMRYPKTAMDMVRIGILQYGFFPSVETKIHHLTKNKTMNSPLKRIISWKSIVMGVKDVRQGEFIGYGTSYFTNIDMKIATIPVGYAHGFNRALSNQGQVLIRGRMARVVGTINMNMMSVDVSDIPDLQVGEEVVIIGHQGDLELTVASFSDFSNLVNYELLTRLPSEIPRIVG
jgi:alanine racemase